MGTPEGAIRWLCHGEDARAVSPTTWERVNSFQHFVAGTEGDSLEHRAGPPVLHSREFGSRTAFGSGENESELARPASTWGRMPAADNLVEFGVATWNIGGGSETKCQDFLPGLIGSHRQLSNVHFVLLQEATQTAVTATPTILRGWTLLLHKHEAEWRGQGLMVRDCWGSLTRIQGAPGLLTAVVGKNKDSIGLASIHLPPKATLDETETMLAQLGGHRHYNNLALSWVSTAMRPSISKGQKSDLVPRGERPYLSGRSIMSSDCHYNKALLHPISPTVLLNNHADLTTFGFGDFVHLGKGKYCRKPGP